jgi:N-methylhydantoinase A
VAEVRADAPSAAAYRDVFFEDSGPCAAGIYHRDELLPGHAIAGPAIIEQLDTTTPIYPRDRAVVDRAGNLIIQINA